MGTGTAFVIGGKLKRGLPEILRMAQFHFPAGRSTALHFNFGVIDVIGRLARPQPRIEIGFVLTATGNQTA